MRRKLLWASFTTLVVAGSGVLWFFIHPPSVFGEDWRVVTLKPSVLDYAIFGVILSLAGVIAALIMRREDSN